MIELLEYSDSYAREFREINLEWLEKYGLAEPPDLLMLNNPQSVIIDSGGVVYLARHDGAIIGSAALLKEHNGVYELAKMTVVPAWQGRGISKLLLEKCLQKASELGAKKIILFSNHQLRKALKLYEGYGFKYVEVTDSPFQTADIKMELVIAGS